MCATDTHVSWRQPVCLHPASVWQWCPESGAGLCPGLQVSHGSGGRGLEGGGGRERYGGRAYVETHV